MKLSKYIKIFKYDNEPDTLILYSIKRASTVLVPESVLKSIEDGSIDKDDADTLKDLGLIVSDINEEMNEVSGFIEKTNKQSKMFTALIVLNLDCNLGCKYCFEGTMKGRHYMSSETADMIIDFIKERYIANGKSVHLDFYGGEPLLSAGLIKYISERIKASADEQGVDYAFNLVTNGTLLTKKRAKQLIPYGLKDAKITLDGPKENHDRYRPFKTGAGSFDTIIRNIKEVSGIMGIQIGGNYTQDNYRDFPLLLDHLLDQGITPDRIHSVKFDPVTKTRKEIALPDFTEGSESVNEPWVFEAGLFLREEILKRGFHSPKMVPSPCMIEINDDIVINYNGTIYKCPALIGWQDFETGNIKTGISDYSKSHNLEIWKNRECLDCEYLPLCFGGCRFMKLLRDNNIDGVDCRRELLDATMETLVKQDIKYNVRADDH